MAFAVYENFEKGYGLCYNNKRRPPPNVISAVAVTRRPLLNSVVVSVVAHRLPFLRPLPKQHLAVATVGNCYYFCARFAPYFFNCMLSIVHVTTQINSLHGK